MTKLTIHNLSKQAITVTATVEGDRTEPRDDRPWPWNITSEEEVLVIWDVGPAQRLRRAWQGDVALRDG